MRLNDQIFIFCRSRRKCIYHSPTFAVSLLLQSFRSRPYQENKDKSIVVISAKFNQNMTKQDRVSQSLSNCSLRRKGTLSKMLSRAWKEHQANQAVQREKQEHLRREAVAASSRLTYKLMDTLNTGVEQAYVNQRKLETEAKQLQAHAVRFSKQTVQWLQMLEAFNKALKELGDVENWSRVIEADMTAIASALEYAYKGDGPKTS